MNKKYIIGLYNPKIEDLKGLEDCDVIFDNFEKFKAHLRIGDFVKIKSGFTVFNISTKEILNIIDEFKLNVNIHNLNSEHTLFNTFALECLCSINEYIKENSCIISEIIKPK